MIRVGMLGADSSHTETYLGLLNRAGAPCQGRGRVVKLWGQDEAVARAKGGNLTEVVPRPEDAVRDVDVVMVCARWGDEHHRLARVALEAGVPTYVDKPLTNGLEEAGALLALAESRGVPAFSCSPYRFAREVMELADLLPGLGGFRAGHCAGLAEWPALGQRARTIHFYGVHVAEIFHAVFGSGIEAVRVEPAHPGRLATVRYDDGRQVALHLLADAAEVYHVAYYGARGWAQRAIDPAGDYYARTLDAILRMAEQGKAPIPLAWAVEIVALLDAIERAGAGAGWVRLEDSWR